MNVYLSTEQEDYSYLCMWTIPKWQAKQKNIEPTWKIPMKDVDLEEPPSLLDHENLGCTQRECTISKDIVTKYRDVFEARICAGAMEKLSTRASGKPDAKTISSCPMTWTVMQRNVWKDIAKLANKTNYTNSHR